MFACKITKFLGNKGKTGRKSAVWGLLTVKKDARKADGGAKQRGICCFFRNFADNKNYCCPIKIHFDSIIV